MKNEKMQAFCFYYQRLLKNGNVNALNRLEDLFPGFSEKMALSITDCCPDEGSPGFQTSFSPKIKKVSFSKNSPKMQINYDFEETSPLDDYDQTDEDTFFVHPILSDSNLMTEARISDMLKYLLGIDKIPNTYFTFLRKNIPYENHFNNLTYKYQKAYIRDKLWPDFFLSIAELRSRIKLFKISSLDELEYRTSEYFL